MRIADVLLLDYDGEIAATRRLLALVPDDKPDFTPHPKSTTISKLALHTATIPRFGTVIITKPEFNMADPAQKLPIIEYKSTADTLAHFDRFAAEARAALAAASDEQLQQPWKFSFGDRIIGNWPRMVSWRFLYFNHMMHHRSQLLVYLRLLDIPIPATYGPSADDRMGF